MLWIDPEVGPVEDKSRWMRNKGSHSVGMLMPGSPSCYPYLSTNAENDLDVVSLPCASGYIHGESDAQDFR